MLSLEIADGIFRTDAKGAVYIDIVALIDQSLLQEDDGIIGRSRYGRGCRRCGRITAEAVCQAVRRLAVRHGRAYESGIRSRSDDTVRRQAMGLLKGLDRSLRPLAKHTICIDAVALGG